MTDRTLDSQILKKLKDKTKRTENTIRKDISILRNLYSNLPINSVAQIYALQNGTSVRTKLTKDEKNSIPNLQIQKPVTIKQKNNTKTKAKKIKNIEFLKYDSEDSFIKDHIYEVNKTYTYKCYTATFILCRKILENFLVGIIVKKYPKTEATKEMYYDTKRGRMRDFSEILEILKKRTQDFGSEKTILERILNRSHKFKDDANLKTHSWYHLVKDKSEIDAHQIQDILNMIKKINDTLH